MITSYPASGVSVAHKTGTSGINNGITAATNDVGVIILPHGRLIFISVLVSDSRENTETNEKIISDISKLAWDYYMKRAMKAVVYAQGNVYRRVPYVDVH